MIGEGPGRLGALAGDALPAAFLAEGMRIVADADTGICEGAVEYDGRANLGADPALAGLEPMAGRSNLEPGAGQADLDGCLIGLDSDRSYRAEGRARP